MAKYINANNLKAFRELRKAGYELEWSPDSGQAYRYDARYFVKDFEGTDSEFHDFLEARGLLMSQRTKAEEEEYWETGQHVLWGINLLEADKIRALFDKAGV